MTPDGWRVLHDAGGDSVVLAVDFWAGRVGAGFDELTDALGGATTVWGTTPPSPGPPDPGRYVDHWLTGLGEPTRVDLVLGHCVGAAFSLALAAELGRTPGSTAPTVVLLNPELSGAATIRAEFARMVAAVGGRATEERPAGGDPAAYAARLAADYRALLAAQAAEDGLDDELVDELASYADGYFAYLAAAAGLETASLPRASVALVGDMACSGLDLAARSVRFDVDRAGLLTYPEVVQVVADMVGVVR